MDNQRERTVYILGTSWRDAGASDKMAEALDVVVLMGGDIEYQVFNAPRPLGGDFEWMAYSKHGEFQHGVFFAAVRMDHEWSGRYVTAIKRLDGWPVELITEAEVRRRLQVYAEELAEEYGSDGGRHLTGSALQQSQAEIIADVTGRYASHYLGILGLPPLPETTG